MVHINLVGNSVLFWGYARETSLDLSKTWVDDNNRFSTPPFVLKNLLFNPLMPGGSKKVTHT